MTAILLRLLALAGPAISIAGTVGFGLLRFLWVRGWQFAIGSSGGAVVVGGAALVAVLGIAWLASDWQYRATKWATERRIAQRNYELETINEGQRNLIIQRAAERERLREELKKKTEPITLTEIIEVPKEIIVERGCTSASFNTTDEIRQQLQKLMRR